MSCYTFTIFALSGLVQGKCELHWSTSRSRSLWIKFKVSMRYTGLLVQDHYELISR